jgi:hypothetical protein
MITFYNQDGLVYCAVRNECLKVFRIIFFFKESTPPLLVDDNYDIFLNPRLLSCKQDNQCSCNVTTRRVHVTIVAVESKKFYIFVCECTLACVSPGA